MYNNCVQHRADIYISVFLDRLLVRLHTATLNSNTLLSWLRTPLISCVLLQGVDELNYRFDAVGPQAVY
jgi:hypothetical protein